MIPSGRTVAAALTGERAARDAIRPAGPGRRQFLRAGGAVAAGGIAGAVAVTATPAAAQAQAQAASAPAGSGAATPLRAPAAPIAVRGPYLSTWLSSTTAPSTWQQFWQGHITALAGIVRIDGNPYMLLGDPTITLTVPNGNHGTPSTVAGFQYGMAQTSVHLTPTRTVFTLRGGGMQVTAEFLSPVEPGDYRRQSIPFSYLVLTAQSTDGAKHAVQLYVDISGEWCSGDPSQQITWAPEQVTYSGGTLQCWSVQLASQQPLTEQNQQAAWGTTVWSTPVTDGLTWQSGGDIRDQFASSGQLLNTNDTNFRAIDDNFPVFGFSFDLGQLGATAKTIPLSIGLARTPAVSYQGQPLAPLWASYFSSWQDMAGFFHADLAAAQRRATALDAKITREATAAGGAQYAALCALALRQAYGGTELVSGPDGSPWAFLKEISSDGNVSTVDVLFPASPAWVYTDPGYLALLLAPLIDYAESGNWPEQFAPHDLGSSYPLADGHNDGGGENMPVEETGNMLIMAAAYIQQAPAAGPAFAAAHYTLFKQWADYLVSVLPDPGFQNQTDDFAGPIAHSVNLALKGIIGVAAMGKIAAAAGNAADAASYAAQARQFIGFWTANAQDPAAAHLDLTYSGDDGGDGTWGTTYNGFCDRLLGTGLVPQQVLTTQAAFYPTVMNQFGLPLQVPHSYAKSDWAIWTAAWLSGYPVSSQLVGKVYDYATTTPSRVPFSDLYDTISGAQSGGFQARPVQGGMFALLALAHRT